MSTQIAQPNTAARTPRPDKPFPVITPKTSKFQITELLEGLGPSYVRRQAKLCGFTGETDILLASPKPSPISPQYNEALGMFYVGESARRYGFVPKYWDARVNTDADLMEKAANANFIGFAAITGYQLSEFVRLATRIKEKWPKKQIVLGGAHATLTDPSMNLRDPLVSGIFRGEGELRMAAWLSAMYHNGEGLEKVDGISYKDQRGDFVHNPSLHVPDGAHLVSAVSEETLPYFIAAAQRNQVILPTSRGCPYSTDSCTFCGVGAQYMDSYRGFPFDLWARDIDMVKRYVPEMNFVEPEDENSALAIQKNQPYLPHLKKHGIRSLLHLRSDQCQKPEQMQWLAEMGVDRVHIGMESGTDRILNVVLKKHETLDAHYRAAKNLAAAGIGLVATFIVGNPTETWEEMMKTLDLAEEIRKMFPKGRFRATVYVLAALAGSPIFYDIETMHKFHAVLEGMRNAESEGADVTPYREELFQWCAKPAAKGCGGASKHPTVPTAMQDLLNAYLQGTASFERLFEESKQWQWPLPSTLRGWTSASASNNPFLPPKVNAIYRIAGAHFNRHAKVAELFKGAKGMLIWPFEMLSEIRFKLRYFDNAQFEMRISQSLIEWANNQRMNTTRAHQDKILEAVYEGMSGH